MNSLVKSALDKLIQDETFRGELLTMLEDVNRTATDPNMVSRAVSPPPPPAADAPAPDAFADVKAAMLEDPEFLKNLTEALMALNKAEPAPAETARAAKMDEMHVTIKVLQDEIEKMRNGVSELSATMGEHDAVLIEMAESAIVRESNQPRSAETFRARIAAIQPADVKKPDLADRASKVLVRMGAK